ncbi:flagellar hook protein FlgE [Variovorax sp. RB2P76]|uniref:flagellar hook protein FlgE n=1 Tax=Variovorax sp. RB2P76 TaxID=3443736 RepID=UPI003F478726
MIDSITIAETGLRGFEQGLRTISNNTANLNTPGFKGAVTQFADMTYGSDANTNAGFGQIGHGLNTLGTTLSFAQGQLQNTGNALDLAIDGDGFFTLKDANGNIHYTQDGQFKFDTDGTLVSTSTGEQVMLTDGSGALHTASLAGLQTNAAKATSTVKFSGNLSSSATTAAVNNVTVIDAAGTTHTLALSFAPVTGSPGSWTATLKDGSVTVGTATLAFSNGAPTPASAKLAFNYTPAGGTPMALTFDMSSNVTSFDTGTSSTLAVASQDGFGVGSLTKETFDSAGTLILTYSNGQTSKQGQLALAQFASQDDVEAIGNNEYAAKGGASWETGVAGVGRFGKIQSGMVEMSNVDLSQEFSNLVIMQRGYQACSQVVSTASEMLTSLFGMLTK